MRDEDMEDQEDQTLRIAFIDSFRRRATDAVEDADWMGEADDDDDVVQTRIIQTIRERREAE